MMERKFGIFVKYLLGCFGKNSRTNINLNAIQISKVMNLLQTRQK